MILDSISHLDVHKFYHFKRVLGHGHFGTVRAASPLTGNVESEVAIKSILKARIRKDIYFLKRELEILMEVDHPNIIRYYESYEDDRYIHIVQEMCTGGDIVDRVTYAGPLSEEDIIHIMRKVLTAVSHLHALFICHRDIKPENFLFKTRDSDAEVKMIDFGMSAKFGKSDQMSSMVGTPAFLAPEVLSARYSKECDVWSLGVMLFYLLSGQLPFEGRDVNETFGKIMQGEFDFSGPEWINYSSDGKDLISRMLVADPAKRIQIPVALHHRWFSAAKSRRVSMDVPHKVLSYLKRYKPPSKLQQEAIKIMVKHLSTEDIEGLDMAFKALDARNTGFISAQDLQIAMFKTGHSIPPEDLRRISQLEIVSSIDVLQQGGIKYSNFLMATLDRKKFLNEEVMYMAFKHLDIDNDGFLSCADLKTSMEAAGDFVTDQEVREMIGEFGAGEGKVINFEEFKRMLEGESQTAFEKDAPNVSASSSSMNSRRSSIKQHMSVLAEPFN